MFEFCLKIVNLGQCRFRLVFRRCILYNGNSRRMIEKPGAQRLEDEGDVLLDTIKRLTQEIGGERGNELLRQFLDGYDVVGQNVLQYRYDL